MLHPDVGQIDKRLSNTTVFEYYGVEEIFTVEALPFIDVHKIERFLPRPVFSVIYLINKFIWGWRIARSFHREANFDVVFIVRDVYLAYWLSHFKFRFVLELHHVPKRIKKRIVQHISNKPYLLSTFALTSPFP